MKYFIQLLNKIPRYIFRRSRLNLIFLYYFLKREPPLSYKWINEELILECVGKTDPIILEIGCNDGAQTLWLHKMFENPLIYCFEPDPRAIARFKLKVGQHPNIHLFEMALSDSNDLIKFYQSDGQKDDKDAKKMPEGWDESGSIKKPKNHLIEYPWVKFDQTITVKTSTLDDWCEEHGIETIDFFWMDVQGAELEVLQGATKSLSKIRFIYTEYNNKELYEGQFTLKQLLRHLRDFKTIIRYSDDVLLRNKNFNFTVSNVMKKILKTSYR